MGICFRGHRQPDTDTLRPPLTPQQRQSQPIAAAINCSSHAISAAAASKSPTPLLASRAIRADRQPYLIPCFPFPVFFHSPRPSLFAGQLLSPASYVADISLACIGFDATVSFLARPASARESHCPVPTSQSSQRKGTATASVGERIRELEALVRSPVAPAADAANACGPSERATNGSCNTLHLSRGVSRSVAPGHTHRCCWLRLRPYQRSGSYSGSFCGRRHGHRMDDRVSAQPRVRAPKPAGALRAW